jgi:RHS repeat-associated protein
MRFLSITTFVRSLSAAFITLVSFALADGPSNPDPGANQLTGFVLEQLVPDGSPNDIAYKLPGRDTYVMSTDNTGEIKIKVGITHTFSTPPVTRLLSADGEVIHTFPATGGEFELPSIKYNSYLHVVVSAASGEVIALRSLVTAGGSGYTDGPGLIGGGGPGELMIPPIDTSEKNNGKNDEGEAGEDYGSCNSCDSCDLSAGEQPGDVTADGPNGTFTGGLPAGVSMAGDSRTDLRFEIDPTDLAGIGMNSFKVHGTGYANVVRSGGNITSVATHSSYVKLEPHSAGGHSGVKATVSADPGNPTTTNFRTVTYMNTGTNEITRTSSYQSKDIVCVWRYDPGTLTWEHVMANGLRKKVLTREDNGSDPTIRVERHKLYERAAGASGEAAVLVSDVRKTFQKFIFGWKKTRIEVLGLTDNPLVTKWEYWEADAITDVGGSGASTNGRGLLKSVTRPDGSVTTHNYSAAGDDVYTHTIQSSFAGGGLESLKEVRVYTASTSVSSTEVTDGTSLLSKEVRSWAGNSRTVESFNESGKSLKTDSDHYAFGDDFGGRPTAAASSDGLKAEFSSLRTDGDKMKTTTVTRGAAVGGPAIDQGTEIETITNEDGVVLSRIETDVSTDITLSQVMVQLPADPVGRPTKLDYLASDGITIRSETAGYGCCGLAWKKDRFGIQTDYKQDDLRRTVKIHSLGLVRETVFDGLVVKSHRYSGTAVDGVWTGTAAAGNETSRSQRDLSGTVRTSFSRSPDTNDLVSSTSTTYYRNPLGPTPNPHGLPAGIGRRSVSVQPLVAADGGTAPTQTSDYYLDGRLCETYGDISPHVRYEYAITATGLRSTSHLVDVGNDRETTVTQKDWAGRTVSVTRGPNTVNYVYETDPMQPDYGRLVRTTDGDGVSTLYAYNEKGERTIVALDINGDGEINEAGDSIDGDDRITVTETTVGSYASHWVYTTETQVIAAEGNATRTTVSTTHRSVDGLRTWTIREGVTGVASVVTELDGAGNWTVTTIDADGARTHEIYQGGLLHSTEYCDSSDAVVSWTRVQKQDGSRGYDDFLRPTHSRDSRTGVTITAYRSDACDAVVSVTDPGARVTSVTYDHRGRRLMMDAPDTDATDPDGTTSTLLNQTVTSYFKDGSVKEVNGDQTYDVAYFYDYAGRMETMTTYYGTSAAPATTTWKYSEVTGQLLEKIYQGGKSTSYTYTNGGRLATREWARLVSGNRVTATYSYEDGQLDTVTYNDNVTRDIKYTYNRLGQIKKVVQGANTVAGNDNQHEFEYDSASFRLLHETVTYGDGSDLLNPHLRRRLVHTADLNLRSTGFELSAPDGGGWLAPEHANLYSYDSAGRLMRVKDDQNRHHTYNYVSNSSDLIGSLHKGHDLVGSTMINQRVISASSYDSTRDLLGSVTGYTGTWTYNSTYSYVNNAIGQRTSVSNWGPVYSDGTYNWAWGYNSKGEVVKADHTGTGNTANDRFYAFDGIGNRLETGTGSFTDSGGTYTEWTPNALNQYGTINLGAPVTPVYDHDGNLLEDKGENLRNVALEYTWDAENRIVEVKQASGGAPVAKYEYDFRGRRILKETFAAAPQGAEKITFIYHGWNPIAEYTLHASAQTLHKSYSWGLDLSRSLQGAGGVGGLLAITDHRSATAGHYYPAYDGNGNLMQLYKDVGGTDLVERVARYDYDPFGRLVRKDGAYADHHRIRFSTKFQDEETGFLYYGYRYYDPHTGRWPYRDPISERGGLNIYALVKNNGTNWFDYLGLQQNQKVETDRDGNKCFVVWKEVVGGVTSQNMLVIYNPQDDTLKKIAVDMNITPEEVMKRLSNGGVAMPATTIEGVNEIIRQNKGMKHLVIVDHNTVDLEQVEKGDPSKEEVIIYPGIKGNPVGPTNLPTTKEFIGLARVFEAITFCNCRCGEAPGGGTVGAYDFYKDLCLQGVQRIYVPERLAWVRGERGEVGIDTRNPPFPWRQLEKIPKEDWPNSGRKPEEIIN